MQIQQADIQVSQAERKKEQIIWCLLGVKVNFKTLGRKETVHSSSCSCVRHFCFSTKAKRVQCSALQKKKNSSRQIKSMSLSRVSALQHLLKWDAVHEMVHLRVRSEVVNISPAFITSQVWIQSPYQREQAQVPLRRGTFLGFFLPSKQTEKSTFGSPL